MWSRRGLRPRFECPRSGESSCGLATFERITSAPMHLSGRSSTPSQSPAPMSERKVNSKSSTSSRSPFQWTVIIGFRNFDAGPTLFGTLAADAGRHFAALHEVVSHVKKLQVLVTWQPKSQSSSVVHGVTPSSRQRPPQSPFVVQVMRLSFEHTPPHWRSAMQVIPGVGLDAAHWPHWMSSSQTTDGSLLQVPTPLFARSEERRVGKGGRSRGAALH